MKRYTNISWRCLVAVAVLGLIGCLPTQETTTSASIEAATATIQLNYCEGTGGERLREYSVAMDPIQTRGKADGAVLLLPEEIDTETWLDLFLQINEKIVFTQAWVDLDELVTNEWQQAFQNGWENTSVSHQNLEGDMIVTSQKTTDLSGEADVEICTPDGEHFYSRSSKESR